MAELHVLIPAAGRGSRAGLPYPKTLYPVDGIPILHRLLDVLTPYDATPTLVVSPQGEPLIRESLIQVAAGAHLVIQPEPRGMGDAVLRFVASPVFDHAEHLLLAWGDLVSLQPETVSMLVDRHFECDNDFTFVTRLVDHAYTRVHRDEAGRVVAVLETREEGMTDPGPGERDIGVFAFRRDPVFEMLQAHLPGKYGACTGEHGFLYVIQHLVHGGAPVDALPVATPLDLVSLNRLSDLH